MTRCIVVIAAVFAAAAGCGSAEGPPVSAANVVVTGASPDMPMAAGYLEISNRSGTDIRISRVSSPDYGAVEMHETVVEDGVARMRELPALDIAHGDTAVFEPGGMHLMLMQPAGTPDMITLNFWSGEDLLFSVTTEFKAAMDQGTR